MAETHSQTAVSPAPTFDSALEFQLSMARLEGELGTHGEAELNATFALCSALDASRDFLDGKGGVCHG